MATIDLCSPDAGAAKDRLIRRIWGDQIPHIVWYDLGEQSLRLDQLPDERRRHIEGLFRTGGNPVTPVLEVVESQVRPGHHLLRVLNATGFLFVIELDGTKYPLYQAGGLEEATDPQGPERINFFLALSQTGPQRPR